MGLVSTILSKYLIDIVTGYKTDKFPLLLGLMIGSTVFSLTVGNLLNRFTLKLGIDIGNSIQADIFDKIIDSDWLSLDRYNNGDLLNRFSSDVGTISGNAISWLPSIVLAIYHFVATFFIIMHYDVVMAILAFASAPFLLVSSHYLISKQREYNKKVREMSSEVMSFHVETFYNFDVIKSFGISKKYSKKLRWWQKKFKDITLEYNLFSIKTGIFLTLLGRSIQGIAFVYCLYLLWNHSITYGTMTLFLSQRADDVNFSYVEGKRVITESDFVANPGEIVALVGPSGEGKTTMIRLVLGLIRPDDGHVWIESDGHRIDANANTRHLFAYVPQTNALLTGTVAENLRMVKEDATDEELIEALKLACAWDFVSEREGGLNAQVRERGGGFSAGQAQRLSIARALLAGAPILLLDEATSALDVTTERQVLRNIIQRRPNRTVIVTTHRPSVLNMCQRVYRVMQTKVTELDEEEASKMAMDF